MSDFDASSVVDGAKGRGASKDYCPDHPADGHFLISRSAGSLVKWVEICEFCGWIDAQALDGWAENAIKNAVSKRGQNIALAAGTEPFAFVQRRDPITKEIEELELEEILGQALGAASVCWIGGTGSLEFDGSRAREVWERLVEEVNRSERLAQREALNAAVVRVRSYMDGHFSKATTDAIVDAIENEEAGK